MAVKTTIDYASVEDLMLDPLNPRLGRGNSGPNVPQPKILELMQDWSVEELAISFLESGFWPQEAVLVVREKLYGKPALVVVEGNRRLAALKLLKNAKERKDGPRKWLDLVAGKKIPRDLFEKVPFIEIESRDDIDAFLGFRHVTGIMEWRPVEKAEYIAKLIEHKSMNYVDVMRKIGSKTPAVRQNYISYRLLLQMEDHEDISVQNVEEKFSVLFLSLRTDGVQTYLDIDIKAEPDAARNPVPRKRLKQLANFALWLFGTKDKDPLITDSRQVDKFGRILESPKAIAYLERAKEPRFDLAYQLAGGDEPETVRLIDEAADNVELALGRAHRYTKSAKLQTATQRLGADVFQLLKLFPSVRTELAGLEA
jgi:hypothetical protein